MANSNASVSGFLKEQFGLRSFLLYVVVFLFCFGTAKFGQYLFYDLNTSPALIWPPFGIALGAILIGGYRMWLPIALAELLAVYSAGVSPLPVILAATAGQTIQPLVAAWAMRKLDFSNDLSRIVDAFILIGVAVAATAISPSFTAFAQLASHTLDATFATTWIRTWAGGMLSVLILTPLISVWLPLRKFHITRLQLVETCTALALFVATVVVLVWMPAAASFGLTGIYVLLAILVWISLRMEPRILTLALFLLAVLGLGGSFFVHTSGQTLNQTLFSQELIIEFFAVIYLVVSALAEERRRDRLALERSVVQLGSALERIEGEDIAKNQFIATLAHELRNPLAPVVSALDLLSLQQPSPEALQTIEGAQRELGVMRRLLDDILDVARISQTRFNLQKEIVDVRPLIERCVESTKTFLHNRNHTLTVVLPREPVMLEVDPVRFQQIIVNLLNNAGKYTPPGGRIELSCSKEGSHAVVRVRDNGIGLSQESLKELFQPFRQIRPSPQLGTGLGIGLWLTKRLTELHGGSIEVGSEGAERGSCFIVSLPLKEVGLAQSQDPEIFTAILPAKKILVVDDNEAAAQAMQKLLNLKGHEAKIAYTGTAAITSAEEFDPQFVLLDIRLPDMSGYDVARSLREKRTNATLVALTGYGQDADKLNAKAAGFDYHLTKPVGIADIEAILGRTV